MLDATGTGLWEWAIGEDRVHWSPSLGPIFGLERGESPETYEAYLELLHPDDRSAMQAVVREAVQRGEGYEREHRVCWADGTVRWVSSRAHVLKDDEGRPTAIVGITGDITERRQRSAALEFIARASAVLAEPLAVGDALERVAQLAVPELADWCSVHLAEEERPVQVAVAHQDPERVALAREFNERFPADPDAPTGVPAVIRTGRSELYPEITQELLDAAGLAPEQLQAIQDLELRSVMTVPMVARGQTLGAITFVGAESGREFGTGDLELAEELGRRAGLTIDNVRLFEQARQNAITLQRSLLPDHLPDLPGLETSARYRPGAAGTEVGGDWYDVIALPSGATAIVVGDVMGRGIRAAALMGQLRTAVRTYALIAADPSEALSLVRSYVGARGDVDFATALLLTISEDRRTVRAASAGHLPPVLFADGEAELLQIAQEPPLGVPGGARPATEIELLPGSSLLLYTDGLIERRRVPIDTSFERLVDAVRAGPASPSELADHVIEAMVAGETDDDVAVLAVRLTPVPRRSGTSGTPTSRP